MKTRDFDPVLSAALRNELETLADGASRSGRAGAAAGPARRRRAWVTAVTAAVLIAATIGVLRLTADHRPPPPASSVDPSLADPLAQVADPTWPDSIRGDVQALLQRHGTGPASVVLDVPQDVGSVRTYVRCAPAGRYTLTLDRPSSASCSPDDQSDLVDVRLTPGSHVVALDVPAGTAWRIAVIVSPGTTTFSTLRVTQSP